MNDRIFTYLIDMPTRVHEAVCPCADGYTIYLNARLSKERQEEAYNHAMKHIANNDFEGEEDVQTIEARAHRR